MTIVVRDKETMRFLEYLVTNYHQSNGLLLEKDTNTLLIDINEKQIYVKYIHSVVDKKLAEPKPFTLKDFIILVIFLTSFYFTMKFLLELVM